MKRHFSKKIAASVTVGLLLVANSMTSHADALYASEKVSPQLKQLHISDAWAQGIAGQKVKIGVIDTGINKNSGFLPNVKTRLTVTKDVLRTKWNEGDIFDRVENGHGTGVAGIINAKPLTKNLFPYTMISVAPQAILTSYKYKDGTQAGEVEYLVKAIQQAIKNKEQIITISSGLYEDIPALHRVIKQAVEQNIVVIASVGNDGKKKITYPARYKEVIAVSSVNKKQKISNFANRGVGVDFVAPGEDIVTLSSTGDFWDAYGTSFSTPYITGMVALLKQQYPYIAPTTIKSKLRGLSKDLGVNGYDQTYGYGMPIYSYKADKKSTAVSAIHLQNIEDHRVTLTFDRTATDTWKTLYVNVNGKKIYRTSDNSLTIPNLTANKKQKIEVRALNTQGVSATPQTLSFTTLKDVTPPNPAKNIRVKVATNQRALVQWEVEGTPDYAYAKVYLNGIYVGKSTTTSFTTKVLKKAKNYKASVILYDTTGHASKKSYASTVKIN